MGKTYWINWLKAAGMRAIKTFAQSILAVISVTGIAFSEVDWRMTVSVAAVSALASMLTSIVGLPELNVAGDGNLKKEDKNE